MKNNTQIISNKDWNNLFLPKIDYLNYRHPDISSDHVEWSATILYKLINIDKKPEMYNISMIFDNGKISTFIDGQEVKSTTSDKLIKGWKSLNNIK